MFKNYPNAKVYKDYRRMLEEMGELEDALAAFRAAHAIHPHRPDIEDAIGRIEQELEGAVVGDTVEVSLTREEAFGQYDKDMTYTDDIDNVPPEFHRIGAEVEMMNDQGETKKFTVTRIEDGKLTVDGNHPMAGKVITFNIRVATIRDATPEEVENGVEAMAMPVLH